MGLAPKGALRINPCLGGRGVTRCRVTLVVFPGWTIHYSKTHQ